MSVRSALPSIGAAVLLCVFAAQALTAPTAESQAAPSASIADIAWLAGRWIGDGLGGQMEEVWSPPAGAQMVGHFRLEKNGAPALYELMLLEEFGGGLRMRVKHFNPTLVGWEERDAWHTFAFVSSSPGVLILGGLELHYEEQDHLTVQLSIQLPDGSVESETLNFRRAPL